MHLDSKVDGTLATLGKRILETPLVLALITLPALPSAVAAQSAVYVTTEDVDTTRKAAPRDRVSDQQIRMIDAGGHNVGLGVVTRPATDQPSAILHHQQTEVYHVLAGRGTMVTGGQLTEERELDSEGFVVKKLTGPSAVGIIEGGETHELVAGEYVIVPAGLAHGFTEIREAITYVVIRVDPEQVVELK